MELKGKGSWKSEEDGKVREYVNAHGAHHWDTMARNLALGRSGNSCRQRWINHLKPHIRRGEFADEEVLMILNLRYVGNGWSKIAKKLCGRTANHIKNFWNTRLKKEAKRLKCDVESEEFRRIMRANLKDRIRSAAVLPPLTTTADPGGSYGTTDTSVAASFSTGSSHDVADCSEDYWPAAAQELMTDHGSILSFQDIEQLRALLEI